MKTRVVNFFGRPSSGKSTLAAGLFYELKMRGINCEQIQEYAKDKVWEESFKTLDNQLYILGKQAHRQFRCRDQVDLMISDSPLLMSLYYGRHLSDAFKQVVRDTFNEYDNFSFFINPIDIKYNPKGRTQTEEEAIEIQKELYEIFKECDGRIINRRKNEDVMNYLVGEVIHWIEC